MCDSLCLVGDRGTLFAKSSDRPVGEAQVLEWHGRRAPGGSLHTQYLEVTDLGACAVVGSRPMWLWGFEHGVNEHRVAIGNERVWTIDDPLTAPPGLIGMDLVRLGLERASTAEAAVDVITALLEEHGQGGPAEAPDGEPYSSSFLVADPGGAWVLETSGRTWAARRAERGAGVALSNRISIGADWHRASADVPAGRSFDEWRDARWSSIADIRLACTRPAVTDAHTTPADLVGVLRHHGDRAWGRPGDDPADVSPLPAPEVGRDGSGVTVCMHVRDHQVTAASMVCDLPADPEEPVRIWAAAGSPCCSVYLPVPGPGGRPVRALAEARTWARFDALRRRAESDPSSLSTIRAGLAPVEARLWSDAPGSDDAAWALVDAALEALGV
jgi:secernin